MYEDAPRTLFSHSQHIKSARKAHKCYLCGGTIPVGSSYEKITGMTDEDDKPSTLKMHRGYPGCRPYLQQEERDFYDRRFNH